MRDSFVLTWRALVRGHVLSLLLAATALAHAFLPAIVRGDGTEAGWREMFVRAVPGAAYAFIAVAALSCACGLFAQERERFRLSLTVVRPASAFGVAVACALRGVRRRARACGGAHRMAALGRAALHAPPPAAASRGRGLRKGGSGRVSCGSGDA